MTKTQLKRYGKRQFLTDAIRNMIVDQKLQPGDQILSQNQLAEVYNVAPLSVSLALGDLCKAGLIYREKGRGTFVGPDPKKPQFRNVALILPGEQMDHIEGNPTHWPIVNYYCNMLRRVIGGSGIFSTIPIPENQSFDYSLLQPYTAVFFHGFGYDKELFLASEVLKSGTTCPVVMGPPSPDIDCVYINHDRAMSFKQGVTELLIRGYRRIGLFYSSDPWGAGDLRGYKEALQDFNIPFDKELTFASPSIVHKDGARAASILMSRGMPCDAVLASTSLLATGIITHFKARGVAIPEDIAVMGYQLLDDPSQETPGLAGMRIPFNDMYSWALKTIENNDGKPLKSVKVDFLAEVTNGSTISDYKAQQDFSNKPYTQAKDSTHEKLQTIS